MFSLALEPNKAQACDDYRNYQLTVRFRQKQKHPMDRRVLLWALFIVELLYIIFKT